MHIFRRPAALLAAVLMLLGLLSGCGHLRSARPITDIHNLDGQRVGVGLSWGPDYLLSEREDMTLMRYNTIADLVTALCFHRVDAIAVEHMLVPDILNSVQGVRCIEEPITSAGVVFLVTNGRKDVWEEFNTFAADFQGTPQHTDLVNRSKDPKGYVPPAKPIPTVQSDRLLNIGLMDNNYPFCYMDFETGSYEGIDIEALRWFAYEYGYTLSFHGGTWNSMELGIENGSYDIGAGGVSDLYRGDYDMSGVCLVTDPYMQAEILFIEVEDPEKLAILSVVEE